MTMSNQTIEIQTEALMIGNTPSERMRAHMAHLEASIDAMMNQAKEMGKLEERQRWAKTIKECFAFSDKLTINHPDRLRGLRLKAY